MNGNTEYFADEKVWRSMGELEQVYDPNSSYGQYIFEQLKKNLSTVLQTSANDNSVVTNEQVLIWAVSIAKQLKSKFSLRHNDIVAIAAGNGTYMLPVELACLFSAIPFSGLNPHSPKDVFEHLLGLIKPKVIFCEGGNYERILAASNSFKPFIYTLFDHVDGVPRIDDLLMPLSIEAVLNYEPEPLVEGADQTIVILCSSGTSGPQKAVCIPNHIFSTLANFTSEDEVLYSPSNLDWYSGLFASLLPCLSGCNRIITTIPFTVEYFIKLVQEYKITLALLPYYHIMELINTPNVNVESLESIRSIFIVGAKVNTTSIQKLKSLLPNIVIFGGYGLTEFGGVTVQIIDEFDESSGVLSPGISACIVNDNDQKLGPNEIGEIWLKSKRTWKGYYNNPMATKEILDSSNWLHTGDVGFFNDDSQLYVIDRKKDIYKYENNNYSPSEIENIIKGLSGVRDVCVVGIDDGIYGHAATAAVVTNPNSTLTTRDIVEHVKQRVQLSYKQLHGGVWFFDKLPYNQNGKQLKRKVIEIIKQQIVENSKVQTSHL